MKQLGWTTLEQSEKLIEAGLDPNTADMFISTLLNKEEYFVNNRKLQQRGTAPWLEDGTEIPCWSLGALIGLMPEETLFMQMDDYWTVTFDRDEEHIDQFSDKILIEALCEAVEWMLENNIINKKTN